MKRSQLINLSVIIAILVVFFIAYRNLKLKENVGVNINNNINQLVMADSYETKVLSVNDLYTIFDVKYPSFKNAPADFNLEIENLVKTQVEDFKKNSADNWQARYDTQSKGDNISKVPASDSEKFSFSSSFDVVQSNDFFISFILRYGGFNGGAHGFQNIVSYNYDLKNKKNIELVDLFSNKKDYLNYLSTESRIYLKNKFAVVSVEDKQNSDGNAFKEYVDNMTSMIDGGTEPKLENFNTFTFTVNKVKIYFADYQVGPRAIGMPEFQLKRS